LILNQYYPAQSRPGSEVNLDAMKHSAFAGEKTVPTASDSLPEYFNISGETNCVSVIIDMPVSATEQFWSNCPTPSRNEV